MKAQIRLGKGKGERLVIEGEAVIETLRASKSIEACSGDEHCYWLYWTTGSGDLSVYLTDAECRELAYKIAKTISMPEVGKKGGMMRKQAEDEQTSAMTWNAVVDALQKHIQYHGEWATNARDYELTEAHLKAQRQALDQGVKALILFVSLSDD